MERLCCEEDEKLTLFMGWVCRFLVWKQTNPKKSAGAVWIGFHRIAVVLISLLGWVGYNG